MAFGRREAVENNFLDLVWEGSKSSMIMFRCDSLSLRSSVINPSALQPLPDYGESCLQKTVSMTREVKQMFAKG